MNKHPSNTEDSAANREDGICGHPICDLVGAVTTGTGSDRSRRDRLAEVYSTINHISSTDPVTEADSYVTAFAWAIVQGFRTYSTADTQDLVGMIRTECVRAAANVCDKDGGEDPDVVS